MIEIAPAEPSERAEIARYMEQAFPRAKWGPETWRQLLDGRWAPDGGHYAIVARQAGKLVGVLGLVTARRPSGGVTANMTSWYLDRPCRGQGVGRRMVELAAADPTVTVTNFSSAVGAVPVVKAAGLTVLDSERLIWRTSLDGPALLKLHREPKRLWNELSAQDQQILEDHRGLNLTPVAVETPDGICLLVLSIKQKSEDRVTFEVMYVGERALLARYAADIANSLLPPDGAIFSVDQRFLPTAVKADAVEAFAVPRFYTAGRMDPGEIDHLYSEIVLLDLKLY